MMRSRRGQNLVEFAVLIGIVLGAFIAMSVYARRGIQAGVKRLSDEVGPQVSKGNLADTTVVSYSEMTEEASGTSTVTRVDGGEQTLAVNQASQTSGVSESVSVEEL